jgi:hypothetical protein
MGSIPPAERRFTTLTTAAPLVAPTPAAADRPRPPSRVPYVLFGAGSVLVLGAAAVVAYVVVRVAGPERAASGVPSGSDGAVTSTPAPASVPSGPPGPPWTVAWESRIRARCAVLSRTLTPPVKPGFPTSLVMMITCPIDTVGASRTTIIELTDYPPDRELVVKALQKDPARGGLATDVHGLEVVRVLPVGGTPDPQAAAQALLAQLRPPR